MAFYDKFPYTNYQEINLDWIMQEVARVRDNRDASDASAAAALESEQAAKASETAAAESAEASAESAQAAAESETAAAGSEAASAEYLAQIGTHTAGAVADWLRENLQPTTPPVDASLTVSGAAADAKVTGERIADGIDNNNAFYMIQKLYGNIENELSEVSESSLYADHIINENGALAEGQNYHVKEYAVTPLETVYINRSVPVTGGCYYSFYDSNNTLLSKSRIRKSGESGISGLFITVPRYAVKMYLAGSNTTANTARLSRIDGTVIKPDQFTVAYRKFDELLKNSFEPGSYEAVSVTFPNAGQMINAETGRMEALANVSASDFYNCENWLYIKYTGRSFLASACLAFYTKDKTHIRSYPADGSASSVQYSDELIPIPENARYVRFGNNIERVGGTISVQKLHALVPSEIAKPWTGYKWAAVGDSLTEVNNKTTMHYHDYIADDTGITVVNMGRSGTGYKRTYDEGFAFYQRIANVPTDSDVVTIFGSGNDQLYYQHEMGTATDVFNPDDPASNTLGACINHTIDVLYSIMPTVHLGIIAPCPWANYNPADTTNGMARYTELLKTICANRSIPFLDLYHCSNLRPWDPSFLPYAYSHDEGNGVHPDETGHKLLAGMIKQFVASLFIPE